MVDQFAATRAPPQSPPTAADAFSQTDREKSAADAFSQTEDDKEKDAPERAK